MSRIDRLIESYSVFISVPWRDDAAAAQRVIFCVYNERDELVLRANIDEFEIATVDAGHSWELFDLTDLFPRWLSSQRYAKSYFEKPQLLAPLYPKLLDAIEERFTRFVADRGVNDDAVVAVEGVGSLYGVLKAKDVVARLAPIVPGRLVVFFPGTCEDNNYRLLDGYDGWNYLAVPITAETEI